MRKMKKRVNKEGRRGEGEEYWREGGREQEKEIGTKCREDD